VEFFYQDKKASNLAEVGYYYEGKPAKDWKETFVT
jgi:hypothetical protein